MGSYSFERRDGVTGEVTVRFTNPAIAYVWNDANPTGTVDPITNDEHAVYLKTVGELELTGEEGPFEPAERNKPLVVRGGVIYSVGPDLSETPVPVAKVADLSEDPDIPSEGLVMVVGIDGGLDAITYNGEEL